MLTAIRQLTPTVKFTGWDFSITSRLVERYDATTQQAAQQFIAFFTGKLDLDTLKARLAERQEKQ